MFGNFVFVFLLLFYIADFIKCKKNPHVISALNIIHQPICSVNIDIGIGHLKTRIGLIKIINKAVGG